MKGDYPTLTGGTDMKGQNNNVPAIANTKGQNEQDLPLESIQKETNRDENRKETSDDETIVNSSDTDNHEPSNVSNTIQEMWKAEALKGNSYIPLKRMSHLDIYDMTRKCVDWDQINPYLSLKEEFSDSSKEAPQHMSEDTVSEQDEKPVIGTIYLLRERPSKNIQHSTRPLRRTRADIDYSKMDEMSDTDSPK